MKKFKWNGYKLYLLRTLWYALAFCVGVAGIGAILFLFQNPLPWVRPLSLVFFFSFPFLLGWFCNRDESLWFSLLPPLSLVVLLFFASLLLSSAKTSPLACLFVILFLVCFLLGRLFPRIKKRRKRFE